MAAGLLGSVLGSVAGSAASGSGGSGGIIDSITGNLFNRQRKNPMNRGLASLFDPGGALGLFPEEPEVRPGFEGRSPYTSVTESPLFQPIWSGQGGIMDALAMRGTGFTPELTDRTRSNIFARGGEAFKDRLAQVGAQASAGGLGRSSLRTAQGQQAASRQALLDQQQALDLERQSQQEERLSRRHGLGLGTGLVGTDVATRAGAADFDANMYQFLESLASGEKMQTQKANSAQNQMMFQSILGGLSGGLKKETSPSAVDKQTGSGNPYSH